MKRLVEKLLAQQNGRPSNAEVGEIHAALYLSNERFEAEQAMFRRTPCIVAMESELAEIGSCITAEVGGISLLIVRGDDGQLRGFRNACRHRSTALVSGACTKRAFVCPYHGWTYDLRGTLIHIPNVESFCGANESRLGLVPAHVEIQHGIVFASPMKGDLDLAPIDADLAELGPHVVYRRSEREVRGNWKLLIDAFLDGYHIRHLHRETVYRFFVDARFEAEPAGDHIRAVTARRTLFEKKDLALRHLVTPSYLIFPNTILILHPDYLSVLVMTPLAPDRTRAVHSMLIPTGATAEHCDKSFALIDEGVFASEDFKVVEAMQRGLESGANETLLFGELEHASLWFHAAIERHVSGL